MNKELIAYAENNSDDENEILKKLYRETNIKHINPEMLSGHLQGKFFEALSKMVKPERILEIGTFTGYSAICLAKGLSIKGILHTIEVDPELEEIATRYFKLSGMEDKIRMHIGDAKSVITEIDDFFDLVYIDADKINYLNYYKLIFDKVKKGGFIIADNVLWHGKVLNNPDNIDKETNGIIEFNNFVKNDIRVENFILPFRDGLMIIRKI